MTPASSRPLRDRKHSSCTRTSLRIIHKHRRTWRVTSVRRTPMASTPCGFADRLNRSSTRAEPQPIHGSSRLGTMKSERAVATNVDVALVIPTFNERDSVRPLLDEIQSALVGVTWNALFVDDSNDGTDAVIEAIAKSDPRVSVLHRTENRGGL